MNNANIEDMFYYENIEDIPNNALCVGMYFESVGGTMGYDEETDVTKVQHIGIRLRVKGTAKGNTTYGFTQTTKLWLDELDRNEYSIKKQNFEDWPDPEWSSGNRQYVKTEYDELGAKRAGTHYYGNTWGQTLLVVGSKMSITKTSINEITGEPKQNYNFGNGEIEATYKLTPVLPGNSAVSEQATNVTLKIEDVLPQELTYIPGSSSLENVEVTNENGTTKLIWILNGLTAGEAITPITYKARINLNVPNGTQIKNTAVISEIPEVIGNEVIYKVGNSVLSDRRAANSITITNLESNSLFKETNEQVIEKNGEIRYKFTTTNMSDVNIENGVFQLLDILPYNGDSRGSNFSGTVQVEKIVLKIVDTISGTEKENNVFNLYITENEEVRETVTVKDENLGQDVNIWTNVEFGEAINKNLTAIAVTGALDAKTRLEIEITAKALNNKPGDIYKNNATMQTNKLTVATQSNMVENNVIKRYLDGKVWLDADRNGLIDEEEEFLKGISVSLLNADGSKAIDINGNEIPDTTTDENGYYKFENMVKGNYKVRINHVGYEVTEKEVGSNNEINSKFNENKITDIIEKLNTAGDTIISVHFVNAGLTEKGAKVIVNHYIMEPDGTTTEIPVPLKNNNDTAQTETKHGKVGDPYITQELKPEELADEYEYVKVVGNANGEFTEETQYVTYYYILKQYPYTVNYYDKVTGELIGPKTKQGEKKYFGTEIETEKEIIEIEGYEYDSIEPENILTIGKQEDKNVINIYYIRKKGTVITKYKDIETGEEIEESTKTEDGVGKDYTTKKKEIPGYVFVKDTENTSGKYIHGEIKVIYYYRKQVFNVKLHKWVDSIIINGIKQKGNTFDTKDKVIKTEINKNKIAEADVKVVYKLRITNDSEVVGKVETLTEKIPSGLKFYQEDNSITWKEENGVLTTEDLKDIEIAPGKYAEIAITLRWENKEENFGTKTNIASIGKANNRFDYEEKTKEDNQDQAELTIALVTGLDSIDKIVLTRAVILVMAMTVFTGITMGIKKKINA